MSEMLACYLLTWNDHDGDSLSFLAPGVRVTGFTDLPYDIRPAGRGLAEDATVKLPVSGSTADRLPTRTVSNPALATNVLRASTHYRRQTTLMGIVTVGSIPADTRSSPHPGLPLGGFEKWEVYGVGDPSVISRSSAKNARFRADSLRQSIGRD